MTCDARLNDHTGKISVGRATVLKHIMRSMHRMMQSSGTSEGLRGLLDSSLVQSVKKVMANRSVFGANVLAIGMRYAAIIFSLYTELILQQSTSWRLSFTTSQHVCLSSRKRDSQRRSTM